jgi:hypothetical protein
VRNVEDENSYVKYFLESEGIELDKASIGKNAARRWLTKFCLNSLWGKMTELNDRPKSKMVADPQELYRFLAGPLSKGPTCASSAARWCCLRGTTWKKRETCPSFVTRTR